jgi:hypothetical protein
MSQPCSGNRVCPARQSARARAAQVSAVSPRTNTTQDSHLGAFTEGASQVALYDTPGVVTTRRARARPPVGAPTLYPAGVGSARARAPAQRPSLLIALLELSAASVAPLALCVRVIGR